MPHLLRRLAPWLPVVWVPLLLDCTAPPVARTVIDDPSLSRVAIRGVQLHVRTAGDPKNPAVIVIHGGPGFDFRGLLSLEALSDRYYVVFYDQRGSGLSERVPDARLTLADLYAELDGVVDHFGGGRPVHLVGHSWGAMLASGYLGQHPEKVDHVVLAEPGMLTVDSAQRFMAATNNMRPPMSLQLMLDATGLWFRSLGVDGPDDDARRDYLQGAMMTTPVPGHPMEGYFCGRDLSTGHLEYFRTGARIGAVLMKDGFDASAHPRVDFIHGVEKFHRKVLFLVGRCDSVIGEAQQQRHLQSFPTAEIVVIEGAGHTMFGEKPAESVAAVRRYLDAPN